METELKGKRRFSENKERVVRKTSALAHNNPIFTNGDVILSAISHDDVIKAV